MLFDSPEFALFLALVLPTYFLLRHRAQNFFLLLASYFFYGFWDWRFLSLLLVSTVVDFVVARGIAAASGPRQRRSLLIVSVCTNLGILGFFKYFNFFVDSFREMVGIIGFQLETGLLEVVLPVGISFYTFQTMSYTIDVYRGTARPERSLLNFALYVAFFPQLVAGPIERATHLLPQIAAPRKPRWEMFSSGAWLILWGLYKKVFVADNLAKIVDPVYADPASASGFLILVATYAFAFQIYADFSGYTDIARGTAKLMGFDIMLNFKLPYFATDPSDFWKRWHISLSQWLRDYLYIPLGGNRLGEWLTCRNLMITMALGGLWHGAAWNFVLWGIYHGFLLVLFRKWGGWRRFAGSTALETRLLAIFVMFHLSCLGWVFFRIPEINHLIPMATAFVGNFSASATDLAILENALFYLALLIPIQILQYRRGNLLAVLELPVPIRALVFVLLYFSITLGGAFDGRAFIYFQF